MFDGCNFITKQFLVIYHVSVFDKSTGRKSNSFKFKKEKDQRLCANYLRHYLSPEYDEVRMSESYIEVNNNLDITVDWSKDADYLALCE